jgi:hypothetical protein
MMPVSLFSHIGMGESHVYAASHLIWLRHTGHEYHKARYHKKVEVAMRKDVLRKVWWL